MLLLDSKATRLGAANARPDRVSVSLGREDGLRVDPCPGRSHSRSCPGDDVVDGGPRGQVQEHASQALLHGLAGTCRPSREFVTHVVGDVTNRADHTRAVVIAAWWRWVGVLQPAAELGYQPNRVAQSLRRVRTEALGLVTDPIASSPFAGSILAGATAFREECAAAGLDDTDVLVVDAGWEIDDGDHAAYALLQHAGRASAVFAVTDRVATGVLLAAARLDVAVPVLTTVATSVVYAGSVDR